MTLGIGIADYLSGYEHRLAMLYLAPLALATWSYGVWAGMITTLVAVLCWLASFYSMNLYTDQIFVIWEGTELFIVFTTFVQVLWQLRKALMRADKRFERVLEGLDAGIYVVLPATGAIAYANPQLGAMLGIGSDEDAVSRFDARLNLQDSAAATSHQTFCSREVWIDESRRCYLAQSGLVPWEKEATGRLTVVRDITEQKLAENARRRQQETQANNARSAVLAEISTTLGHELSQPLMAIANYLEVGMLLLAKNKQNAPDVFSALRKCQEEAARASRILQGTRHFLRQRVPALDGSDLNAVLRHAVEAVQENLPEAQIRFALELETDLPPMLFDKTLIEQVLINLMTNAVQAIDGKNMQGNITVKSKSLNEGIHVSVIDDGPGVPLNLEDQLFKPFFTTKPNGLGLGLSICRSVIEAHGGNIWQRSGQLGGTEFHFFLPVA